VTNADGSTTIIITEISDDYKVIQTATTTKTDGSSVQVINKTSTNSSGKEVAVTTTKNMDADGKTTKITEKFVIKDAAKNMDATISLNKNGKVIDQIVEAAGQDNVNITMTVKDDDGTVKYKVKANTENLTAGNALLCISAQYKNW